MKLLTPFFTPLVRSAYQPPIEFIASDKNEITLYRDRSPMFTYSLNANSRADAETRARNFAETKYGQDCFDPKKKIRITISSRL